MSQNSSARIIQASFRDLDVFDKQYTSPAIYVSHDWPQGITKLIPCKKLVTKKCNLVDPKIGGPVSRRLFDLCANQQSVFVCSHMHFFVDHFVPRTVDGKQIRTRFIALDKAERKGGSCAFEFPDSNGSQLEAFGIYDATTMKQICSFNQQFTSRPAELKIDQHGARFIVAANLKTSTD